MFTPQQIEEISFNHATFGGYDVKSVDEFLGQLVDDYVTLYKENALLKSKMKTLVTKLEEYRQNESSMKDAIVNAQKTCDMMVKEAEAKCTQMLTEANAAATENAKNADALIAAENARVEEAKKAATAKIDAIKEQMLSCLQALDRIKEANRPIAPHHTTTAFDFERSESGDRTEDLASEIEASIQALVGTTDEPAPKAEPMHPQSETTTSKFTNLQFGRNYDPENQ